VLIEAARQQGVKALVAKRMRSPYSPGETSKDWVEVAI
jgi:ATP-dependent DNA ligase